MSKPSFFEKMKQAVTRTRESLSEKIDQITAFTRTIDRGTLDDLEATLITSDLGTATTQQILGRLRERADRKQIKDSDELKRLIKDQVLEILNATPARSIHPAAGDPEVIMVADTFDAMTTNRPYQAAMDAEYVIRIINSLAATKFDPKVVAAMTRVFEGGRLRLHRAATVTAEQAAAAGALNI